MCQKAYLKIVIVILLFCGFSLPIFPAQDNGPFTVGTITAEAGEIKSGYLDVPTKSDPGCKIPVTIINGAKKGKVLALVAGVHGYEYPPILALYRLKQKIDPASLSGTLILTYIANPPGFQKRMIYYNPYDWKNLNRVFPGDPNGTSAQRTAHVLVEEVVKKCDCLIDLHCGDGNEALIPYSYWMLSDNPKIDEITRDMAIAFGLKYIIIDASRTKDIMDSKYLGNTAILHGKPAITTESGYLGKTDEISIKRNIDGIFSVMKLFEMIEGQPSPVDEPVWIDKYEVVYSDVDGLFYPLTEMGYYVKEGEQVGYVMDYLGETRKIFRAPFTGILLYLIHTPPTSKGEPLFEVGQIKK
ncbi:MAG: M14 family metallopeptidase [Candidatus Aminicenantes bacterium]|nr:M14 family metallopeptidase [Candidatus Aminicenantes bacterium]